MVRMKQFTGSDGKRRTVRLGKLTQRQFDDVCRRIDSILGARLSNQPIERNDAEWLGGIGDDLHARLASVGLVPPRVKPQRIELKAFLDGYLAERTDAKPSTRMNLSVCVNRLVRELGAATEIGSVTKDQAKAWAAKLRKDYAAATASRTIRRARQLFTVAIERGIIKANPFDKIKAGTETNRDRQAYIGRDTIDKVLTACPSNEWRLIVTLARYAGLRIPSELQDLTWRDIDWEGNRFTVRSPKKEGQEGHSRFVPIFPEVAPYLDAAFDAAEPGAVHVIAGNRNKSNLRTQFERIIRKADFEPWERLFHNLRASRK